jgi:hypothetical protein
MTMINGSQIRGARGLLNWSQDIVCLESCICFVLEGWFDISDKVPDLKQIGKWASKAYRAVLRLKLNFGESREYCHGIVRPDFDPKPFKHLHKMPQRERLMRLLSKTHQSTE